MKINTLIKELNDYHSYFDEVIFIVNNVQTKMNIPAAVEFLKTNGKELNNVCFTAITNSTVKSEFDKLKIGGSWYDPRFFDGVDFQNVIGIFDKDNPERDTLAKCIEILYPDDSNLYDAEDSY